MIVQSKKGLISRSDIEINDLPLITAPMYSVVNDYCINDFLSEGVQVCMPREDKFISTMDYFPSVTLKYFKETYLQSRFETPTMVCIDTANGNNPDLHKAITDAKTLHGDNIIIMSGNVGSVQAFEGLAESGCDYIRVGIGSGGSCNTSLQTGVGQKNLEKLIHKCYKEYYNVKIVADGISAFINKLVAKKEGLDNGYAAINRLLYAGADLVMIGKLFAQCLESAGQKYINDLEIEKAYFDIPNTYDTPLQFAEQYIKKKTLLVDYYGMSSIEAQAQYNTHIKASEGSFQTILVRWKLRDWLYGNNTNELPGWVNTLKSAMSYTGSEYLNRFKKEHYGISV